MTVNQYIITMRTIINNTRFIFEELTSNVPGINDLIDITIVGTLLFTLLFIHIL